ncbi:adenylate/guanylate cyclase domain-containing protein [Roseibium sediminicola]|uniref:Adenylate/guanylate cyclase domain-containing protein n=1 Tax=Roseibium sediminicola TaxID=2933272 RepID=A0ABT0GRU5_9HYPH|nr:adenylate/guanylate cyclase domain-containing protein [Roseibium sp. CAU 1639]MCK7612166.1 adenylate/guanylate cyclase domain-containing protein [Roseibium sp. CAU 1639]
MQRVKRRLAAIMCADVAQYSKLMERDEDGTLDRLKAYRSVMSSLTEGHNGRIVNTWGDAVIIEFSSVTEAVQCAVDIQNELSLRNSELPDLNRMEFRIGINLGDIMVEGDDIYGDGVNVAARLQEIAPKGGIMLSQSVYDQVKTKMALGFDPLGPQHVKNVTDPVETYAVRLGGRNAPQESEASGQDASDKAAETASHPDWDRDTQVLANGFEQARRWLRAQPRKVRSCVFLIGFFFVLNLLTSGLSTLWFVWPSLPFAMMLVWHLLVGRKEKSMTNPSQQGD